GWRASDRQRAAAPLRRAHPVRPGLSRRGSLVQADRQSPVARGVRERAAVLRTGGPSDRPPPPAAGPAAAGGPGVASGRGLPPVSRPLNGVVRTSTLEPSPHPLEAPDVSSRPDRPREP